MTVEHGQEPGKKKSFWKQIVLPVLGLKWVPWVKNVLWLTATGLAIKAGDGESIEGAILTLASGG